MPTLGQTVILVPIPSLLVTAWKHLEYIFSVLDNRMHANLPRAQGFGFKPELWSTSDGILKML